MPPVPQPLSAKGIKPPADVRQITSGDISEACKQSSWWFKAFPKILVDWDGFAQEGMKKNENEHHPEIHWNLVQTQNLRKSQET